MKGMRKHLQMYMKNKTTHLQVSNWQKEKKKTKKKKHVPRKNRWAWNKNVFLIMGKSPLQKLRVYHTFTMCDFC